MSAFPKVEEAVRLVLKRESRRGTTTKKSASTQVWQRIKDLGGPSKFGIGTAAMHMGCIHIIETEVMRQFKSSLTDHEYTYILPSTMPAELTEIMTRGVYHWIAIEDGPDAMWRFWRLATPSDWQANAAMKRKKAEQTLYSARYAQQIADYLSAHGLSKLGDVFS